MDGITDVTARIGQIEARIAQLAGRTATTTTSSTTSTGGASASSLATTAAGADFATALSTALDTGLGTGTAATPSGTGLGGLSSTDALSSLRLANPALTSTALTADGAPVSLVSYGNGKIPASALSPVGEGHQLWAPAATAYTAMTAAAARDGVDIGLTDSYRSYAAQVDVAERKGLYSQGGLAAKPGTSDHGWGRAVDLDLDSAAQTWMRTHGADYGFVEDTPREPWHWAYTPPAA